MTYTVTLGADQWLAHLGDDYREADAIATAWVGQGCTLVEVWSIRPDGGVVFVWSHEVPPLTKET